MKSFLLLPMTFLSAGAAEPVSEARVTISGVFP